MENQITGIKLLSANISTDKAVDAADALVKLSKTDPAKVKVGAKFMRIFKMPLSGRTKKKVFLSVSGLAIKLFPTSTKHNYIRL